MDQTFIIAFIYLLFLSFIVRTIRNTLYQVFLWQIKEYRIDRFISHLRTVQGKKLIFGPVSTVKWILLPLLVIDRFVNAEKLIIISNFAIIGFGLIFMLEAILAIKEFVKRGWKVPKYTLKAVFILTVVFLVQFSPLIVGGNIIAQLLFGPFMDKLLAPLVAVLIISLNAPVAIIKKIIIFWAKLKVSQFQNLTVIGITGSYGKTSTKEFLSTILSEKFKVAKTPEFTNTDIGIAKFILKELQSDCDVFVVEMGAYKKGEIRAICDMVKPKIGIITGINEQHLELFGSIEETVKAKFELIESLPDSGVAVINGNNKYSLLMAKLAKEQGKKVITYDREKNAKNLHIFPDHLEFEFIDGKVTNRIKLNLLGRQNIGNILASILSAQLLGLTWKEINRGLAQIVSPDKTMKFVGRVKETSLIDDTFNANPDGAMAAIDFIKIFKGKKIIVLTPLIELGNKAYEIHKKLGKELVKVCDLVLLTNNNYNKAFFDGITNSSDKDKIHLVDTSMGEKYIRQNLSRDGIIIFEGKEAGRLLNKLLIECN